MIDTHDLVYAGVPLVCLPGVGSVALAAFLFLATQVQGRRRGVWEGFTPTSQCEVIHTRSVDNSPPTTGLEPLHGEDGRRLGRWPVAFGLVASPAAHILAAVGMGEHMVRLGTVRFEALRVVEFALQ